MSNEIGVRTSLVASVSSRPAGVWHVHLETRCQL
jgi:hypothetical protein